MLNATVNKSIINHRHADVAVATCRAIYTVSQKTSTVHFFQNDLVKSDRFLE